MNNPTLVYISKRRAIACICTASSTICWLACCLVTEHMFIIHPVFICNQQCSSCARHALRCGQHRESEPKRGLFVAGVQRATIRSDTFVHATDELRLHNYVCDLCHYYIASLIAGEQRVSDNCCLFAPAACRRCDAMRGGPSQRTSACSDASARASLARRAA